MTAIRTLRLPSGQRLSRFMWTARCESSRKEKGYRSPSSPRHASSAYEFKLGICTTELANALSSETLSLRTRHSLEDLGELERLEAPDLAK